MRPRKPILPASTTREIFDGVHSALMTGNRAAVLDLVDGLVARLGAAEAQIHTLIGTNQTLVRERSRVEVEREALRAKLAALAGGRQ